MKAAAVDAAAEPTARPFLKWAGGKGQLLGHLSAYFPAALSEGRIHTYIEPFLGGGAMFFHLMQRHAGLREAYLMDANEELVLAYKVVQNDVVPLIAALGELASSYLKAGETRRLDMYQRVRAAFNRERQRFDFRKYSRSAWVKRAAQILFLNKTCYNGLFRVNRSGEFNVPVGKYVRPAILDAVNLRAASSLLERAVIRLGDFGDLARLGKAKPGTFIYYDPPYLPLSRTANFTAYSKGVFGVEEQRRLAGMFRRLDRRGIYQMLSNSDPKNVDPRDDFFEDLYSGYGDRLFRVPAARSINSVAARRGKINEIVITSYRP